ncbi:MAG: redoxin family protein [Candidatus Nanohaloarchaea archaeon]|nr:redoxin family protein [Candidatus Nanohaloarchaea archaeon]
MDRRYLAAGVLAAAAIGVALVGGGTPRTGGPAAADAMNGSEGWRTVQLTDVRTGETFTIAGFDRPVLLESFAVWCPTCTRQQEELKELHGQVGDDIVSVSIDIDPNEDAQKVRNHIERHGFDWRYVVAPAAFTRSLVDEFGRSILNAPLAPMVVVCPDGTAQRLPDGVKTASTLQDMVDQRC